MNLLPKMRVLRSPGNGRRLHAAPRLEILESRNLLSGSAGNQIVAYDLLTRTQRLEPLDAQLDTAVGRLRMEGFLGHTLPETRPAGLRPEPETPSLPRESIHGSRTIFGSDDRTRVTPTTDFPWRAVGRMTFTTPGGRSSCSGAMLGSFHFLTAAHCIHGGQGQTWYTNLEVALAQDGPTNRPYAIANATYLRTYTGWTSYTDWNYDFALVTLDRRLGNHAGWLGYEWYSSDSVYNGMHVNSAGYPGDLPSPTSPIRGTQMYAISGRTSFATTYRLFFNGTLDVMGGQSGSSIWRYDGTTRYVNGVVTHHACCGYPNHNSGSRMTQARFNNVNGWKAEDTTARPPTDRADLVDYDAWFSTNLASFSRSVVRPGDSLTTRAVTRNNGTAAAGGFRVSFYASTNDVISTADHLIGSTTLSSLGSFSWADAVQTSSFPDVPAGRYHVGWIIDSAGAVPEFDESNNTGVIRSSMLTVLPRNLPPTAVDDVFTVREDAALLASSPGVLANDRDPDGNPLRAALVAGPREGTLTLDPDGSFVYVPRADFHGTDSFTYRASDGEFNSGLTTVTLTVSPVNDAPRAAGDAYTVNEDALLGVALPGVLGNDQDVDGDALRLVLVASPQHGTLTLNADGSFVYVPRADFHGTDSFTYRASDGALESAVATVTITVNPVNDAPVLSPIDPQLVYRGKPFALQLTAADVDGDRLTYGLEPGAPAGLVIDPDTGVLRWTPGAEHANRPHTITVRVTDSGNPQLRATQSFTITVRNPGRFQLSADTFRAREGSGPAVITITRTDGDSGGVSVRYCTRESNAQPWACGGTVTFEQGETQKTVSIPLGNDDLATLGRTFQVRLADPTGGAELAALTTALVQIDDDDLSIVPDRAPPANLGQAAAGFAKSREQYTNLVTGAYQRYLERAPEQAGLEGWVTAMLNGQVTEERLEAGFIGSPEYIANNGGRGRGWVVGMYQDLLGRDPAEAEVQAWLRALANGVTETDVAFGFAASAERQGQRVQRNYRTYLDRDASPEEVAAWVDLFKRGLATNQDIIARFVGSPEYYQSPTKGRGNGAVWIVRAYEQVLFRSPARTEVEGWLRSFGS